MDEWEPRIGMIVVVTDDKHCGGDFKKGVTGIVTIVDDHDSFLVQSGDDCWWHCRDCAEPLREEGSAS